MLSEHIEKRFRNKIGEHIIGKPGLELHRSIEPEGPGVSPFFACINAEQFLKDRSFRHEFFGPFAFIIKCADRGEMMAVANAIQGQLTVSLLAEEEELPDYADLIEVLTLKTGRIIFNGVPTGVEVCASIHHGGPFPASSSAQYTAVGIDAIQRFVRPVCFQSFPDELLPEELKDINKLRILRRINGVQGRQAIPNT